MRSLLLASVVLLADEHASAQQPSQVHLYCLNGQADLRLTRQFEGRSVCLIRSSSHESTARDWAQRNLQGGSCCSCG